MPGYTALTTTSGRERAERLGAALEGLEPAPTGVGVFALEDGSERWEVGGYFDSAPDSSALALLAAVHGSGTFRISELADIDWVARVERDLPPVEAGRFYLYGAHDAETVPAGRVALRIEASMAFGTGHHPTTVGCLALIDRLLDRGRKPARVADIGCGTGVLAMAAARVWDARVLASDSDSVAVEVAEANLAANGLAARVETLEADGLDHPRLTAAAPFDLVLANILKEPLIALAPDMARHTAPGGYAVLSGLLSEQSGEVAAAYGETGFTEDEREELGDWTTLLMCKTG